MYLELLKPLKSRLVKLHSFVMVPPNFTRNDDKHLLVNVYNQLIENRKDLVVLNKSFTEKYNMLVVEVEKEPTHLLDYSVYVYKDFMYDINKTRVVYENYRHNVVRALYDQRS